ncbi:MAG: hypothetical protein CMI79_06820 [Candidatus Pelagibacter sp.]|nr:hypothetical protein [Candidatus Pelagibacter sp.]|tara:strand:+ start:1139 stop:2113 length:975 start_codon:yes stop_codon:yes gene_type:complete
MSKENITIKETTYDLLWDEFIMESINKSFYSLSEIINLEKEIKKYFVYKNNEIIASFSLVTKDKNIILPTFSIYTPINYKEFTNIKLSSANSMKFIINDAINKFLTTNFNEILISYDFYTNDIRPYIWRGYPDTKKGYEIKIKYTYLSEIKNLDEKNYMNSKIFINSSETNRREIRNSLTKKYEFKELFSKKIFFSLKNSSYKIHNKEMDNTHYEKIFKVYENLEKKKLLKMFVTFENSEPVFMTIFSLIKNKSIFLHSGRSSIVNNNNLISIFSIFKSIIELSKNGIEELDFEGMNSPNNSKSKIKFGGYLMPYYNLKLNTGV